MPARQVYQEPLNLVRVDPRMSWREIIRNQAARAQALGWPMWMLPGVYTCDTKEKLGNAPLDIYASAKVRIKQTLVYDADPQCAAWVCSEGAVGIATTLTAPALPGDQVVQVAAAIPVGAIVRINAVTNPVRQFHSATRVVLSVSGGGLTLHLDEPLYEAFATGEFVSELASVPTCIRIFGGGMSMSGTGWGHVAFAGAYQCRVEGIRSDPVDGSPTLDLFTLDTGGRWNSFSDIQIDAGGVSAVGIVLESQNRSFVDQCVSYRTSQWGIALWDCCVSKVSRSAAWNAVFAGLHVGGNGNSTGCIKCEVESSLGAGSGVGIHVRDGSTDTTITNCNGLGNTSAGLEIGEGVTVVAGTNVVGGRFAQNDIGIHIDALTTKTKLSAWPDVTGNASQGVFAAADWDGEVQSAGGAGVNEVVQAAGRATARVRIAGTTNVNLVLVSAGAELDLVDPTISGPAAANAFGVLGVGKVLRGKMTGAAAGAIVVGAGACLRTGQGLDVTGCAAGVVLSGGGAWSRGFVTMNGTGAPQTIPFVDIRAEDVVTFTPFGIGGVPGPYVVQISPGVGFLVYCSAGDTGVFGYAIE